MSTAILIPCRLDSTRLPNKMLVELNGVPLIKRVYNACLETSLDVYVCTDSEEIASLFPKSVMTSSEHENGTSRCAEAITKLPPSYHKFINVQGDMPDINMSIIFQILRRLATCEIATAYTAMSPDKRRDANTVKMIHSDFYAHWFLRAPIEYGDHHLGIYGYTRAALLGYPCLQKYEEEEIEKLEQLRWIQNNMRIGVTRVNFDGIEINTQEDVDEWHRRNG